VTLHEEWVDKEEGDYKSAVIINRTRKETAYDAVCYHCQQCAEKYLKAYLIQQGTVPRRTHDLEVLLSECANYDANLSALLPLVRLLDPFSVQFRYPGDEATEAQAKDALATLRRMRRVVRRKMGF
jgi:HEPN domain-containing protein